jgi:hypothetical protein
MTITKTKLQNVLNNINNKKYYYIIENENGCEFENNWDVNRYDLVDYFYDDIFNNELKNNDFINKNDFYDWRDQFRDNDDNISIYESMVVNKIVNIIDEYIKVNNL